MYMYFIMHLVSKLHGSSIKRYMLTLLLASLCVSVSKIHVSSIKIYMLTLLLVFSHSRSHPLMYLHSRMYMVTKIHVSSIIRYMLTLLLVSFLSRSIYFLPVYLYFWLKSNMKLLINEIIYNYLYFWSLIVVDFMDKLSKPYGPFWKFVICGPRKPK